MQETTRRGMLAAAGAGIAATAGCSELSSAIGGGSSLRGESVKKTSKTFTLGHDEFEAFKLTFDQQTVLFFSALADTQVDVITFTRENFKKYRTGNVNELPVLGELSDRNTKATSLGSAVTAGDPVVVVDNTTWADAKPAESVKVEFELEAFIHGGN